MKFDRTHVLSLILGAVLPTAAVGTYKLATSNAQAATAGLPRELRWLDEGPERAYRFALATMTTNAAGEEKPHEIICEHNGTVPRQDGTIIAANAPMQKLCNDLAALDRTISADLDAVAGTLVTPAVPADMAHPPADMAGGDAAEFSVNTGG